MIERATFYRDVVHAQIKDREASILVLGGGPLDKDTLEELGFTRVTISNLDERMTGNEFAPFEWKYENAESLSFSDESFDYVIIHAAIHHAYSPHRVLTEMYRVATIGALAFESRDSMIMRYCVTFGLTQEYEHSAVYYNDCRYGGVGNTEIPNYIYRWTESEIEKTINSYSPCFKHSFTYRYGTAFPALLRYEKRGKMKLIAVKVMGALCWLFTKMFPKQQNLFAFYIKKPDPVEAILPWLVRDDKESKVTFNKQWGEQRYKRK